MKLVRTLLTSIRGVTRVRSRVFDNLRVGVSMMLGQNVVGTSGH
jgi:hypothetical protein